MSAAILDYDIHSSYQAGATSLRLLPPADPARPFVHLYILPVNPGLEKRWGDGLEAARQLGLGERWNLLAIAPSFSDWPWYADHPANPALRQESYLIHEILPRVEALYPAANPRRLLLGFSKSGNGAFSLLLRRPDLFHAAAAWDAPLMKTRPDEFEMPAVYGSAQNFAHYALPGLFRQQAELLRQSAPRLGLFGFGGFREHLHAAHELLERLHIPHVYADGPRREHRWDSGWLAAAAQFLLTDCGA